VWTNPESRLQVQGDARRQRDGTSCYSPLPSCRQRLSVKALRNIRQTYFFVKKLPMQQDFPSVNVLISTSCDCTCHCGMVLAAADAAAHRADSLVHALSRQTAVPAVKLQLFVFCILLTITSRTNTHTLLGLLFVLNGIQVEYDVEPYS